MQEGLKQVGRGLKFARDGLFQKAYGLELLAKLHLALGEIDDALECSIRALDFVERMPGPDAPESKYFTHAQILRVLGRESEVDEYLRRAYERVMLVANNTKDEGLKRSWLENVRVNQEILEACVERGIGK